MEDKVKMVFDDRINYGSKEHFFHLLLGYLLPSIYEFRRLNSRFSEESYMLFESSGPVMDTVIQDLLGGLNIKHLILSKKAFREAAYSAIEVQRWDILLLSDFILEEKKYPVNQAQVFLENVELIELISRSDFRNIFRNQLHSIRSFILDKLLTDNDDKRSSIPKDVLLIKRSPAPFYYSKKGDSKSSYGTTRRALLDVDAAAAHLGDEGISAIGYEPGSESIVQQIRRFYHAHSMVGIRGAEFANAYWMQPGSKVILIKPPKMNTPPVQEALCQLMQIKYKEIDSREGQFPSLMNIDLIPYLR